MRTTLLDGSYVGYFYGELYMGRGIVLQRVTTLLKIKYLYHSSKLKSYSADRSPILTKRCVTSNQLIWAEVVPNRAVQVMN